VSIGVRVKPDEELNGLDISEHGVYGYSEQLVATDHQNGSGRAPEPQGRTLEGTA
jgi:Amt family ammonium transporter